MSFIAITVHCNFKKYPSYLNISTQSPRETEGVATTGDQGRDVNNQVRSNIYFN